MPTQEYACSLKKVMSANSESYQINHKTMFYFPWIHSLLSKREKMSQNSDS
jgi:hypothetical protein